jgi:hypothetical protein
MINITRTSSDNRDFIELVRLLYAVLMTILIFQFPFVNLDSRRSLR